MDIEHLENLKKILRLIDAAIVVFESSATWEIKYDAIFGLKIPHTIEEAGFNFDWYDPDMDYEDDVTAFINAIKEFKGKIGDIFDRLDAVRK